MIVEDGVELSGFSSNYGTYLRFSRELLHDPMFIEKCVRSIANLRSEMDINRSLDSWVNNADAYNEYAHTLIELTRNEDDFLWTCALAKRVIYSRSSTGRLPSSFWSTVGPKVPSEAPNFSWACQLHSSSRGIKLKSEISRLSPTAAEAVISLTPPPEPGDFVEFTITAQSRYLNPVWISEASDEESTHLNAGSYKCADGTIFLRPTRRGIIEFKFPRDYGLSLEDIVPFVAIHTITLASEVKRELERVKIEKYAIGANIY